ncbi:squalene/phytoene synthase family protein [Microvirga puerhi]|uniref:Squalene/phytoene synthase family protein n=1 Tax=Microvirga puerhi TaxID=2876078 RepID=A0ABS7VTW6_9HYPH|nr:squalene/phytoene synthase family protein [Microvirga puerhi]MBZ6079018.1 squalene/phytoene synthase family protein [Microvirga puerhi]
MHARDRLRAKRPKHENFPVASLMLSRVHRDAVLAFYRFARLADDVADAPDLTASDKLAELEALEQALICGDPQTPEAAQLHAVNARHGAGVSEARDLLRAFRQDAVKTCYQSWADLVAYCAFSANPVGHFLLRLHGEHADAQAPANALCTALQILNHMQDCRLDWERLKRLYLPLIWIASIGGESTFFEPSRASLRRPVLDTMLNRVDALIDRARVLPERLQNRGLRAQSIATIELAGRLSQRLRSRDPVITRVEISKSDAAIAFLCGLGGARCPVNHDHHVTSAMVQHADLSYRLSIQTLSGERRRAIHAVYAFYRAVDDIADGVAPPSEKRFFLGEWRREIDRLHRAPETPVGRELARALSVFALPLDECHALLDGMETDSVERVRFVDDRALDLYSRRISGSACALLICICGAPNANDFAFDLGRTLQLVNLLLNTDEDAARERVYVPLSRLALLDLYDAPAATLVADPRFVRVCQDLSEDARASFAAVDEALKRLDRCALKPAILMMESHRRILNQLVARGWGARRGKLRLTATDRFQLITLALRPE